MRILLILCLCLISVTAEIARLTTEKYGANSDGECVENTLGATCKVDGAVVAIGALQFKFNLIKYKTQMLPKAQSDGVYVAAGSVVGSGGVALKSVSDNTGHRFVKTTVALVNSGNVVYNACGVKFHTDGITDQTGRYFGFVTNVDQYSGYNDAMKAFTSVGDTARFVEYGTCSDGNDVEKADCDLNAYTFLTTEFRCEYILKNNMYLGLAGVRIAFQKTDTSIFNGKPLTTIGSDVAFKPSLDDPNFATAASKNFIANPFQNENMRDLAISYESSCFSAGKYLREDKGNSDCKSADDLGVEEDDADVPNLTPSDAAAGTVRLKLTGVFMDPRYKVVDQSGVEELPLAIGDVMMIKEGLELHADYRSFNDPVKDVLVNGGDDTLHMTPIPFRLRKKADSTLMHTTELEDGTEKDFTNMGIALGNNDEPRLQSYLTAVTNMGESDQTLAADASGNSYRCYVDNIEDGTHNPNTDDASNYQVYSLTGTTEDIRGPCMAQYVLDHTFTFTYGDLPHFKPGYIGCDICESVIAVKAFKENVAGTDKFQVNTRVAVSVKDLPAATNDITIKTIGLLPKQAQFALEPNLYYKLGNLFDVTQSTYDLLNDAGSKPSSLDDNLNMFGDGEFLSFSSTCADGTTIPPTLMGENFGTNGSPNDQCGILTALKLHNLATDTKAAMEDLLANTCDIQVPTNFYGTDYKLKFRNTEAEGNPDNGDEEHVVTIREQDNRQIKIGAAALNLDTRVEADIERVATTITMAIKKTFPETTIPQGYANSGNSLQNEKITFRLKGSKADFAGFVSTLDGGAECAGDKIYWKSNSPALRTYKLPDALQTGSNALFTDDGDDNTVNSNGPWGVCDLYSGTGQQPLTSADLPLTDGTQISGPKSLVTYDECKNNAPPDPLIDSKWTIVSVPNVALTQGPDFPAGGENDPDPTADNYLLDGNAWADHPELGVHLGCTAAAVQEEVLFTSSAVNGATKSHSIRSTDQCTGKIDLQLEDQTQFQEFAIFKTRIECSRVSTQELSDDVHLKYEYDASLDLEDNSLIINANYSPEVETKGFCQGTTQQMLLTTEQECTDSGASWTAEYTVEADFGYCSNTNSIEAQSAEDDTLCPSTLEWVKVDGESKLALSKNTNGDPVDAGLQTLLNCHDENHPPQVLMNGAAMPTDLNQMSIDMYNNDPELRKNIASYVITYNLALKYTRDLDGRAGFEGATIDYCDDQQFTATIRRDAKASTTVAQIKAASLNRAVVVQDVGWVGNEAGDYLGSDCTEANSYQLEIIIKAMDQDARGSSDWVPSQLTKAFIDTASDAQNSNNMKIHKPPNVDAKSNFGILQEINVVEPTLNGGSVIDDPALPDVTTGNYFKVRSECVIVTECVTDPDNTVDGDSWDDLTTLFKTDLVIRGTFLRSDVDSKIELTVNFNECPVAGDTTVDGEIRVGLQLKCNDDQALEPEQLIAKSIAQPSVNDHDLAQSQTLQQFKQGGGSIDCSQAFADDIGRVEGFVFATQSGCTEDQANPQSDTYNSDCALFKAEKDIATANGWQEDIVDVYIDRYDTSSETPLLTSATRICRCDSGTGTPCRVIETGIANLDDFVQYPDAMNDDFFSQYQACGGWGAEGKGATELSASGMAALLSGGEVTGGTVKMKHQFPLMPMSSATADLFKVRYEVILINDNVGRRRRLRSSYILKTSQGASATTNGLRVLEIPMVDESAGLHNHTDAGHEDEGSHTHEMDAGTIAAISLSGVAVIALAVILISGQVNKGKPSGTASETEPMNTAASSGGEEEGEEWRRNRFKNLRY